MSNEQQNPQNNQNDNAKNSPNLFFPKSRLKNLTILIDADNVTSFVVEELFYVGRRLGQVSICRAYADWRKEDYLLGWDRACLFNGIDAIQQFAYRKGKNSSDIRLVIDAMELSFSEKVDGFLIASSDSDFTPLVMNLRQRGFSVYGFGRSITHHAFKGACNYFYSYDEFPSFQEKLNKPHYHPKGEEIRLIELKEWKEIEEKQAQWRKAQQEGNKNDMDLTEELEENQSIENDATDDLDPIPVNPSPQPPEQIPETKNSTGEEYYPPDENKEARKKNIPAKKTYTFKKTYSWLQWLQEFLPNDLPASLESGPVPPEYQNLNLSKKEKEKLEKVRPLAYDLIRKHSDNQGWTAERAIKSEIENSIENFSPANYGCKYFSVVIFALDNICVGYREQRRVEQWQEKKSFPQSWARYYRIIDRERLIGFLNNAIEKCKDETGWAKIDDLPYYYTFKPLNFGFRDQRDLLCWLGYEVQIDENGDKTRALELQDEKLSLPATPINEKQPEAEGNNTTPAEQPLKAEPPVTDKNQPPIEQSIKQEKPAVPEIATSEEKSEAKENQLDATEQHLKQAEDVEVLTEEEQSTTNEKPALSEKIANADDACTSSDYVSEPEILSSISELLTSTEKSALQGSDPTTKEEFVSPENTIHNNQLEESKKPFADEWSTEQEKSTASEETLEAKEKQFSSKPFSEMPEDQSALSAQPLEPEMFSAVFEMLASVEKGEEQDRPIISDGSVLEKLATPDVTTHEENGEEQGSQPTLPAEQYSVVSEILASIEKKEIQDSHLIPIEPEKDYSEGILMTSFEDDDDLEFLVSDFHGKETSLPEKEAPTLDQESGHKDAASILEQLAQQQHFCGEEFVTASNQLSLLALETDNLQDKLSVEDASFAAKLLAISDELRSIGENIQETPSEHSTPAAEMIYRIALEKWAKEISTIQHEMLVERDSFAQLLAAENQTEDNVSLSLKEKSEPQDNFLEVLTHVEEKNPANEKVIYSWREFYPDEDLDTVGPIFPTYYESYCNKEFDVEKLEDLKPLIYDAIYVSNLGNGWAAMSDIEKYIKYRQPHFNPEHYDCLNLYYLLSMVNNLCPGYERDQETEDMIPTEKEIYFCIIRRGELMNKINHFISNHDKNAWVLTSVIEKSVDIKPLKIGFKDFDELLIWLGYEIKKDIQGYNRIRIKDITEDDFFPDFSEYPLPEKLAGYLKKDQKGEEETPVIDTIETEKAEIFDPEIPEDKHLEEVNPLDTDISVEEKDEDRSQCIQVVEKTIPDGLEIMPMSHFYPPNSFVHQKFYLNAVKDYLPVPNYDHENLQQFLKIKPIIYSIIRAVSDDKGWALLKDIENCLQKNIPNFSPDYYGFPNTISMLKMIGDICLGYDKNQFRDLRAEYGYTPFNKLKHYYIVIPYHDLLNAIVKGINQYKNNDGWVNISQLEEYIRPLFDFQYYGFYYFSDLLSSILILEVQNNFVRLKDYEGDLDAK